MNVPQSAGDAVPNEEGPSNKTGYIMLAVYGVLTLLFCCCGVLVTGLIGADSESDGMDAAMAAAGPGCCAVSGFLMSGIGLFAFKGKSVAQIAAPIVVGIIGGVVGVAGIVVFFSAIWPSL